jgi:Fe-S-cluster containining protein
MGMPQFHPERVNHHVLAEGDRAEYFSFRYSCDWLGADGRCTNYDERPALCRSFAPKSDPLCIERDDTEAVRVRKEETGPVIWLNKEVVS